MINKELFNKLAIAEKYFKKSKYSKMVEKAIYAYNEGTFVACETYLNQLPTEKDLLKALLEKLKGKSVYRTLKKIQENKLQTNFTELKGLTSLLTHVLIECEKSSEYRFLIPSLLDKINEVTYNVI